MAADVLVATLKDIRLYEHGTSLNKLYDYLAAGRPIVFGAHGSNNPVSESGGGLVVPPENATAMADALIRLSRMSDAERCDMGRKGLAYVQEHHDIRILAGRLESVLQDAVSRGIR
jgi:glycosyltransferase involved in cell wall biosynthesis